MIKYVKKIVWYRRIYFRMYTLSEVAFLHTSYPYEWIVWHTIIHQTIPQVYFGKGLCLSCYTGRQLPPVAWVLPSCWTAMYFITRQRRNWNKTRQNLITWSLSRENGNRCYNNTHTHHFREYNFKEGPHNRILSESLAADTVASRMIFYFHSSYNQSFFGVLL